MTYSIRNIVGVLQAKPVSGVVLRNYDSWPYWLQKTYDLTLGCHLGHALDFLVAVLAYLYIWPLTYSLIPPTATFKSLFTYEAFSTWMWPIFAFNLVCCYTLYGFWHYMTYSTVAVGTTPKVSGTLAPYKYNEDNQYHFAEDGHLRREVFLTTLGWLQSGIWQILFMWIWKTEAFGIKTYEPFFSPSTTHDEQYWRYNAWSVGTLLFITYWREFHFYWVHRMMHPYEYKGIFKYLDLGQFLYDIAHSLHHKSVNPGPFSGLSMHPIEHFFYYSVCAIPLIGYFYPSVMFHPMVVLYALHHANVSPIGGHDGYSLPGGGGDFHYLHHAAFQTCYGTTLVDFDSVFDTWCELSWWKTCGKNLKYAKAFGKALKQTNNDESAALKVVAMQFNTTVEAVTGASNGGAQKKKN